MCTRTSHREVKRVRRTQRSEQGLGRNKSGDEKGDENGVGGRKGGVNGYGNGNGDGRRTGVEVDEGTQDGNGDGSGDEVGRVKERRICAIKFSRAVDVMWITGKAWAEEERKSKEILVQ